MNNTSNKKHGYLILYSVTISFFFVFLFWLFSFYLFYHTGKILGWFPFIICLILACFILNRLISKLYYYSYHDSLTGLCNRKYLYSKGKISEINTPTTALMIDIDDFKNINDTKGHITGDKVLIELSRLLEKNTREKDEVIRWGGEEFVVLLNSEPKESYRAAERIREAVKNHEFSSNQKITVSIGIATIDTAPDLEKLIEKADVSLHRAKKTKNTVMFSE